MLRAAPAAGAIVPLEPAMLHSLSAQGRQLFSLQALAKLVAGSAQGAKQLQPVRVARSETASQPQRMHGGHARVASPARSHRPEP